MTIVERGYAFVPLPPRALRAPRPEATHAQRLRGRWSGRVEVEVTTEQPVHFGSGFRSLEEDDSGRFRVRRGTTLAGGAPVMPGSGLKGAIRARYEAITHSCLLFSPPKEVKSDAGDFAPCTANQTPEEDVVLCPACALFGMMSRRARVSVEDFVVAGETRVEVAKRQEQFGPQPDQLVSKGFLKGRKFAVGIFRTEPPMDPKLLAIEVLPRGTLLRGGLRVLNLTDAEVGGLVAALGVEPESRLKVGGGKGVGGRMYDATLRREVETGFGRARVTKVDLSRLRARGLSEPMTTARARAAFMASDDYFAEGERRLVALHGGDC
jgi:hypothetical protein